MTETHNDFVSLSTMEKEGRDFRIFTRRRASRIAVVAPHGGDIEPGTSEIARAVSGEKFTCYCFEGIKNADNKKYLHITSTNFDEPECNDLCRRSNIVVTIHGAEGTAEIVFVGGRHEKLKRAMVTNLRATGFNMKEDATSHPGQDVRNICNRGILKKGLQLEISNGLRKKMFQSLNRTGRIYTTETFNTFIQAACSVLKPYDTK